MELDIKDRFVISMCLPQKGTFSEFSLKKEISKRVQFSEDEISKFDIKFNKESNTWNWNTEVDSKVHILFSDEQQKYLKKVCEDALETDAEFTDEIWITLENLYNSL